MSNKVIDALAFCPFYMSESKQSITCEGLIGSSTVSRFISEQEKLEHENSFCTQKTCKGCAVYAALEFKYARDVLMMPKMRH